MEFCDENTTSGPILVLEQNRPNLNKFQTNLRNVCVSVILEFCVSFAPKFHRIWVQSIHTFWHIKIPVSTASYATPFDFIKFFLVFSYIIDDHSYLNCRISTKLLLIACLIKTQFLIYWPARYGYKLRNVLWFKKYNTSDLYGR